MKTLRTLSMTDGQCWTLDVDNDGGYHICYYVDGTEPTPPQVTPIELDVLEMITSRAREHTAHMQERDSRQNVLPFVRRVA